MILNIYNQQSVSPQCSPQTNRKQTTQHKVQFQCPTVPLIPAPPIPPRRQSPHSTPHQSPGVSPKHNNVTKESNKMKITKTLTPLKVNEKMDKISSNNESDQKFGLQTNGSSKPSMAQTLTPPALLFGTWPGAAATSVVTIQQTGVSQSASTSPTNVIMSSPLIQSEEPTKQMQSSAQISKQTTTLSTNRTFPALSSLELNEFIEEHSYANTQLSQHNRKFQIIAIF